MLDISMVNETSPEGNWNRQADRQVDGQDHVLSQADALIKNLVWGGGRIKRNKKQQLNTLLFVCRMVCL